MTRATYFLAAFCLLSLCSGCADGTGQVTNNGADADVVVVIDPARGLPGTPPPGSPEEAVMDFHDGMQSGNLDHAKPFVAMELVTDAQDRREVTRWLGDFSRSMADDAYDFRVLESREDGECAIVVVQDTVGGGRPNQLRPFYLVRHRDQWKVLPRLSSAQGAYLAREQRDAFVRLLEWFESAKDDGRW